MKQKKILGAFLSGMLAGAVLLACGSAALAAGGSVNFGTMGLRTFRGKTVVKAGDTITNATGCEIPSTIVYTDEKGGDNTYLHIRTVGEALDIPVDWADGTVYLGGKPGGLSDITVTESPTYSAPTALSAAGAKASHYTEVEPYWPTQKETGRIYDNESRLISGGADGAIGYPGAGKYVSLSITNNTETDMYLLMRCCDPYGVDIESFPTTLIPAGKTVVRTFLAGEYTGYTDPRQISYYADYVQSSPLSGSPVHTDVTISAVSFSK